MKIKFFQIDAFAKRLFTGNPAAVCLLDSWLSDEQMQCIAAENNLAETAFVVRCGSEFEIRWFTPKVEVKLCGHATLATAHALMEHCGIAATEIVFHSADSGALRVRKEADRYVLDFPADSITETVAPTGLFACIDRLPSECYRGATDYMMVFDSQKDIETIEPEFHLLKGVESRALIVTAPGDNCDFVSRFFAPQVGIDEDPVTGSAHTTLIPFWSKRLGKTDLIAQQLSQRGGMLYCRYLNDRVEIGGHAVTYLVGEIDIRSH